MSYTEKLARLVWLLITVPLAVIVGTWAGTIILAGIFTLVLMLTK